jgi:PAS domain-containing protein
MKLPPMHNTEAHQNASCDAEDSNPQLSPVVIFEWEMPRGEMRAGRSTVLDALAAGEDTGSAPSTTQDPTGERKGWWRRLQSGTQRREGEAGGRLKWFGAIDAHLGYEDGAFPRTIEAWRDALHPEDCARVLEAMARHGQTGEPYALECRAQRRDGSYLHWTHSGTATRDDRGNLQKFVATFSNITHGRDRRALAEKRAREEKARAESLLRTAAHLNAQLDLDGVCQAICEEAARTIGAPAAVMLFDRARNAFVPSATINMPPNYAGRYTPTVREIYDRHVSEMGTLFLFTDAQATPDLPNHRLYREVDMRTIGIASLIREGEVLGLLKVYSFVTPRVRRQRVGVAARPGRPGRSGNFERPFLFGIAAPPG